MKNEICDVICLLPCEFSLDENWIQTAQDRVGRLSLACNDNGLDPKSMLQYCKEQNVVERGFRFIKNKRFHVSEVYLKNENRIAALSMLILLCLLIYSAAEWWFRKILKEPNATAMNPRKKPNSKPSM